MPVAPPSAATARSVRGGRLGASWRRDRLYHAEAPGTRQGHVAPAVRRAARERTAPRTKEALAQLGSTRSVIVAFRPWCVPGVEGSLPRLVSSRWVPGVA